MIDKISFANVQNNNRKVISFKNSSNDNKQNNAKIEKRKNDYKNLTKMGLASALVGLGTLGAAKIAKKDSYKSLEFGICAYFITYIVMALINGLKEACNNKESKS